MREQFILSELFVVLNLILINMIHNNLIKNFPQNILPSSQVFKIIIFIYTPFSMYAGFTWFNLFHNGFIAFTDKGEIYAIIAAICAWILAIVGFAWTTTGFFSNGLRDGVCGAAITWLLLGVAVQQHKVPFLFWQC